MTARLLLTPEQVMRDRSGWLAIRRQGLTASEIAEVLDISPHGTPFSLYVAKQTGDDDHRDVAALSRGRHLEPVVSDMFESVHPELELFGGGLYCHEDRPWQMATFDRLAIDTSVNPGAYLSLANQHSNVLLPDATVMPVQIKTSATKRPGSDPRYWWGDAGTDEVPLNYRAQALYEMDIATADIVLVPALFMDTWECSTYIIERTKNVDDDIWLMREMAEEFLERLARDDPPPVDWRPETTKALHTLHPDIVAGTVQITRELARQYRSAKLAQAKANRRVGLLTNRILTVMGNAKYAETPPYRGEPPIQVATRMHSAPKRVNVKLLRAKYPHIARECEVEGSVDALHASAWARPGE